jgi:hypothetical protein
VENGYIRLSELPGAGLRTLTDILNGQGMMTIFLTLLATIFAMRIARNKQQQYLARQFDCVSFTIITVGFALFVVLTSMAALP